jgi:hypothetical protein
MRPRPSVRHAFAANFAATNLVAAAAFVLALVQASPAAADGDDDKQALAQDVAVLFRSARGVISDNQALINDPAKADKGLTGAKVIAGAKEKYAKAAGHSIVDADPTTLSGQVHVAMFAAIKEVMDQAQPLINEPGKGFKGFLPAVFAKQVADRVSKRLEGKLAIKLTAPPAYVRNRSNRPDAWETGVLTAKFASAGWTKNKPFGESTTRDGHPAFRLMLPEYYGDSCMSCHGEPRGERDISGGKKEGAKLGDLGGAISVTVY